jgi:2-hydroxychromene-2-carboxylate isomerase
VSASLPDPEFLFDFGSPNAFLAHRAIPAIAARLGVRFTYTPILLGGLFKATGNRSPAEAFAAVPAKLAYMGVETARFLARHQITDYRPNPHFPVNTLQLMRLAVAAREAGLFDAFVEAAFVHMWSAPKKMDDPDICRAALAESGLPVDRLWALSQSDPVKQALIANTEDAARRGAFGAPTFFLGEAMFFGKDQLRDLEDEIVGARG